jgi:hypothetical protein
MKKVNQHVEVYVVVLLQEVCDITVTADLLILFIVWLDFGVDFIALFHNLTDF